eukprot:2955814-Amphidinium_carterae.1
MGANKVVQKSKARLSRSTDFSTGGVRWHFFFEEAKLKAAMAGGRSKKKKWIVRALVFQPSLDVQQ